MLFSRLRVAHLRVSTRLINWRPDLKVWRHWVASAISWARLVSGGLSRSKVIQVAYFAKWVENIVRTQGRTGLVKYLKVAHVQLMQGVPGSELKANCREIGKVAVATGGSGLPRVIPAYARNYIRKGDASTIRFWLTMLGMYRIVPCKGQLKLGSIVEPGASLSREFKAGWVHFVRNVFLRDLERIACRKLRNIKTDVLERPTPTAILTASSDKPGVPRGHAGVDWVPPTSFGLRFNSAIRWTQGEWGWSLFRYLSLHPGGVGTTKSLWTQMEEVAEVGKWRSSQSKRPATVGGPGWDWVTSLNLEEGLSTGGGTSYNGRLSTKVEPAGKIRVFALVDYWTQISLMPLHKWIFSILEEIPQDGTFDQLKPIKRLLKRLPKGATAYSFDLSAATDRIPVLLQAFVLASIFGRQFAATWRSLLCGRSYWIGKIDGSPWGITDKLVRYKVGQPMGALSSWGMLALVHHAMVQYSAYRAGWKTWFDLYAVLGDDVVIANDRVATEYRNLCEVIGVEIGIAKSLIAKGGTLEFAKKFFFRGEDLSGLPIKFWAAAQNTMGVTHALSAWYPTGTLANFLRAMGIGFKGASMGTAVWEVIPKRLRALLVLLTQPLAGGKFAAPNFVDWLMSKSPVDRRFDIDSLSRFNPWATGLQTEVIKPARDRVDEYQEMFFQGLPSDPALEAVNSSVNRKAVSAMDSLEKAEKSMQHLQSLDVKFNPVQCSAIFQQVVRVAEKVDDIGIAAAKAEWKTEPEVKVVNIANMYSLWERLRKRIRCHTDNPPMGKC